MQIRSLCWLHAKISHGSRELQAQPLTKDFDKEVHHVMIPKLHKTLSEVGKGRDDWLKGGRGKLALKAAGISIGLATAVATLVMGAMPATMGALALTIGGIAGSNVFPALEVISDWNEKMAESKGQIASLFTHDVGSARGVEGRRLLRP